MTPAQHATEANTLLDKITTEQTNTEGRMLFLAGQYATRAHLHAMLSRCPGTGAAYADAETRLAALATKFVEGDVDRVRALATLALAG